MQAIHFCIHARASIIGPSNVFVKCFSPYAPNHRPSVAGSNSEEKIVPFYQKRDIYIYVGGGSEESDWCDTFYFNGA